MNEEISGGKKISVLYHRGCADGFGGAFAAYKKFGRNAEYLGVEHGNSPPEGLGGKEIYIIDFSYAEEILRKMAAESISLTVIDHHLSAEEAVKSAPRHLFSLEHSGAVLAWQYFHPRADVPKLLLYVEDGDLWRFKLPFSREIQELIYLNDFNFEIWKKFAAALETEDKFRACAEKGAILRQYKERIIERIAESAGEVEFEGYKVLAVNAPHLVASELGHLLASRKPPFGIVWYYEDGKVNFSLRSDGSVDVSELAKIYGGGGHKAAAGFRLDIDIKLPFKSVRG